MNRVKRLESNGIVNETDAPGNPALRKGRTPRKKPAPIAPDDEPETSRNTEGRRQAGTTPRHTDKPIVGGNRE